MRNIQPIPFAHLLIAPPMDFPFGLRSGGSIFGAPRDRDEAGKLYDCHRGIDLFPRGAAQNWDVDIYAVNWGTVEYARNLGGNNPTHPHDHPDWEVLIRHHPDSSGVYTQYRHLKSVESAFTVVGTAINAGDRIGRIAWHYNDVHGHEQVWPHLHFMWAVKTNLADLFVDSVANPDGTTRRIFNCIPLDPTPLLYRFESYKWQSPNAASEVTRYEHDSYLNVTRIRVISWPNKLAATWLMQVRMGPQDDYFYLPINDAFPHERAMADVISDAFKNNLRVKLIWRDSYFYGQEKRNMIDEVRVIP